MSANAEAVKLLAEYDEWSEDRADQEGRSMSDAAALAEHEGEDEQPDAVEVKRIRYGCPKCKREVNLLTDEAGCAWYHADDDTLMCDGPTPWKVGDAVNLNAAWELAPCDCGDCDKTFAYPPAGTQVATFRAEETREVGDDRQHEVVVPAAALGVTMGYVTDWTQVHVLMAGGRNVWLSPDNLMPAPGKPFLDVESSASRQHFIDTGRYLTHAEVAEYAS